MIALKLAFRNLVGAGLRTWLNVIILSFSFIIIIWHKGLIDGWDRQSQRDMINWEIGGGQYWHENYDPYDPFTIIDAHGMIPGSIKTEIKNDMATPVLISQATIYPEGRIQSILLKGIDPAQKILSMPSEHLMKDIDEIPVMIGTRMAKNNKLNIDDYVTVRWRDANGTFDAADAKIVHIFKTNVPALDNGQMWIPLSRHQNMMQIAGEATIVVIDKNARAKDNIPEWSFKDHDFLLADFKQVIQSKYIGGSVLYIILMFLAMLAIFDTQILSIFRRQKEIGTHIALGMTRGQVIRLFTVEGAMHGILAAILAAIYGIPLLSLQAKHGFAMPGSTDDYGLAITEKLFPYYSMGLVAGTTLIVLLTTTIVSFIPARKIAKMKPTDAIRGKIH
jgi:ABC-type lipoprotein release transport system permease subunit